MTLPLYGSFPLAFTNIDPLLLLRILLLLVVPWVQPTYFKSSVNFSLPVLCISINHSKELVSVSASQLHRSPLVIVHQRAGLITRFMQYQPITSCKVGCPCAVGPLWPPFLCP